MAAGSNGGGATGSDGAGTGADWAALSGGEADFVFDPTAMKDPHSTQNMRLGLLGVSQLQQATVADGTIGFRGAAGLAGGGKVGGMGAPASGR